MERIITGLVNRFAQGTLSRRELIQTLTTFVAAASASEALAQAPGQAPGLRAVSVNHVGVLASDLQRSADFYTKAFGLSVVGEDAALKIVRLGTAGVRGSLVSLRQAPPYGQVDHFALTIDGFNREAAADTLKQRGIATQQTPESGFHVRDPDGTNVQMG